MQENQVFVFILLRRSVAAINFNILFVSFVTGWFRMRSERLTQDES